MLGIAVLVYLYIRHPERLPEMRRVFADEAVASPRRAGDHGERVKREEGYIDVPGGRVWYRSVGEDTGGGRRCCACTAGPASRTTTSSPWRRWPTRAR